MARRDYKHRATRRKKRDPVPVWIWLAIGYLAGAASVGFLWLKFGQPVEEAGWIGDRPPAAREAAAGGSAAQPPRKKAVPPPDFDFYNLLPDQEVVVPEEELNPPAAAHQPATPPSKPASAPGRKYMLQVSSVRSAKEADAMKAKLAFLGLQAQVSRARIKGVTWYRVRLGPFSNTAEMQRVRKRLASQGYQALPIALK